MNIFCYKREKNPNYSEKQAEKQKKMCKNQPSYYIDCHVAWFWTMKKYFTYDDSNMQGNDNYYTNDISKYPDNVRFDG